MRASRRRNKKGDLCAYIAESYIAEKIDTYIFNKYAQFNNSDYLYISILFQVAARNKTDIAEYPFQESHNASRTLWESIW